MTYPSIDGAHSCGYHCDRPACIKAQRDYLAKQVGMAVQPQAQAVQAVPMTDSQIEVIGHRRAWRYKKSGDQHKSDTYVFDRHTLIEFARAVHAVPHPSYVAPQPPAEQSQSRLTDEQVYWIAQNYGIGVHTCDVLGFYADLMSTTGIVEPARGDVPASGQIKTGFCKLKAQPGGCPMNNLQCGWPDCDKGE